MAQPSMQLTSINPATEEVLAQVPGMDFEEAFAQTKICRDTQQAWVRMPIVQRCEYIKKLADVLRKNAAKYAKIMTLEMGKPITQSKAEVEKCAGLCEFYAQTAPQFLAPEMIKTEAHKSYVRFDPLGVVLGIMPWNFPFWQVFRFAVPVIAAGNGAVLKHASNVPQCAMKIEEVFREAGFPQGLFKTLLIDSQTSSRLIESDAVDAVSLTGSTGAGESVAQMAGKHLKKCVLELGGSDPFIVLADADLDQATKVAIQARTTNTGQSCIAAKRFIVEASVAQEFEKKLTEQFKTLKIGNPMDETVQIGPLAKAEIRDDIERQVNDAVSKGAKILSGGKKSPGKGYFFEPTLITNVNATMAIYLEETFGPVMPIIVAADRAEAVQIANSSPFGLGASVWTKNLEVAEEMAAEIESGFVAINAMVKSDARLPFGGVKKSGFGRELGSYGIKEFVNIKTVVVN